MLRVSSKSKAIQKPPKKLVKQEDPDSEEEFNDNESEGSEVKLFGDKKQKLVQLEEPDEKKANESSQPDAKAGAESDEDDDDGDLF